MVRGRQHYISMTILAHPLRTVARYSINKEHKHSKCLLSLKRCPGRLLCLLSASSPLECELIESDMVSLCVICLWSFSWAEIIIYRNWTLQDVTGFSVHYGICMDSVSLFIPRSKPLTWYGVRGYECFLGCAESAVLILDSCKPVKTGGLHYLCLYHSHIGYTHATPKWLKCIQITYVCNGLVCAQWWNHSDVTIPSSRHGAWGPWTILGLLLTWGYEDMTKCIL